MKKVTLGILIGSLLLLAGTQAVWAAPAALCPTVHIVQWGETLSHIALRYGTTVQAIAAANGIANPNRIYAGQRIFIPGGTAPVTGGAWYAVRWGDTLSSIAWRHGVSVWAIVHANNLANPNRIYAGQRLYIP